MTYPRSHLVDPSGGLYHVCSRCVRRAFLCGFDSESGYNYEHRRQWIEDRILFLSDVFAVDLFGYAVMSNHYHLVIEVIPSRVDSWSDEVVADNWLALFPREDEQNLSLRKQLLLQNPERLSLLRGRLGSLSWFMRCLNEPIARLANKEDHCKGRFWEGRFKSQRILDESGLLAAMVYVDLNPIRARLTSDIEDSQHTSLHKRLKQQQPHDKLHSLNKEASPLPIPCTLTQYLELAKWTAIAQSQKRPISISAQRTLVQANAPNPMLWLEHYLPKPNHWQRALGSFDSLAAYASELNQNWIKTRSAHLLRS